jgi:hypothetical protein
MSVSVGRCRGTFGAGCLESTCKLQWLSRFRLVEVVLFKRFQILESLEVE